MIGVRGVEQTVYGDVLFLINFSMDFIALYICARILHKKIKTLPLTLAASLGGAYAVTSLFFETSGLLLFLFDAVAAYVVCLAAFGLERGKKPFLSALFAAFVFFVAEMLLGGVMTALMNLLGRTSIGKTAISGANEKPLWIFALLAPVSSLITFIWGRLFGRSAGEKTAQIKIECDGNALSFSALVDSANLLEEPISGRPVVIIGYKKIKNFLPGEVRALVEGSGAGAASITLSKPGRVRFIPAASVGGKSVLVGFVPDSMEICAGGRRKCADAVVAIEKDAADFGGTDAIIPGCLVNT